MGGVVMASLPDLDRRFSRKIEAGKGIQLSADDLDLFVSTGAYDVFRQAVAEYQRTQCQQRNARSRSTSAANSPSTNGQGATSRSSGMTTSDSVSEAQARLRAILNRDD
ncbi:hypothetical protein ASG29_12085 [Sphingomonas sp. Leaf412]|nr:hypothetical protein ASG29_12085 [Sphingomonas sp. Leaf412]